MDTAKQPEIRVLSLFSGIGGLDLGVKLALRNAVTKCYVEIEAFPISTLVQAMEEGRLDPAPLFSDITLFKAKPWRDRVDLVIAGAPCQPYSLAGLGLGKDDHRALWPYVRRILDDVQAPMVFLENVPGQLSRGFEAIGEELQGLGYRFEAGLVRAKDVGAPHKRERLFVFGYRPELLANAIAPHLERWRTPRDLASPSGDAGGEGLQRQWSGCTIVDCSLGDSTEALVDAEGIGRGEGWPEHELRGRRNTTTDPGCPDDEETLADTTRNERSGSHRQDRERWGVREAGQSGDEGDLGDAAGAGLPIGLRLEGDLGQECPTPLGAGGTLPMWPPGPAELDEWRAILRYRPDLAPAIPAIESRIRGISSPREGRDWLDDAHEARIPRLASLGNGVVPQSVALALSMLVERASLAVNSNPMEVPA